MLYWSRCKLLSHVKETKPVNYGKPDNHAVILVSSLLEATSFVLTGMVLENIIK